MRGRGRKPSNSGNRVLESNGPDVKIRGSASHIAEKYVTLARDAQVSGDRIVAENYLQHAEHYFRIVAAAQPPQNQNQGQTAQPKVAKSGSDGDNSANADRSNSKQPSEQKTAVENHPSADENHDTNVRAPKPRGRRRRKPDNVTASQQPDSGVSEKTDDAETQDPRPGKKVRSENGSGDDADSKPAIAVEAVAEDSTEVVATVAEDNAEPKKAPDPDETVEVA